MNEIRQQGRNAESVDDIGQCLTTGGHVFCHYRQIPGGFQKLPGKVLAVAQDGTLLVDDWSRMAMGFDDNCVERWECFDRSPL